MNLGDKVRAETWPSKRSKAMINHEMIIIYILVSNEILIVRETSQESQLAQQEGLAQLVTIDRHAVIEIVKC